MRYAVVSDIHANGPAWKAVSLDLASLRVDRTICLGDVVGYGPHPAEVLESVYASVHHFVLGNHDAALCGRMDDDLFNDDARAILEWTRGRLRGDALRLLRTWPLSLKGPGFRCAHGEFERPGRFGYVDAPEDALPSWRAVAEPLLFVGHSHCPGVYLLGPSGVPHRVAPQDLALEDGKRYLIDVGSVGQPRDGDARASYVIYDADAGSVFFRRIPFDLDAYRAAVEAAGLPPAASAFLRFDPRRDTRPLRARVSFRPPETTGKAVRGAVDVRDLEILRGRVRRWKGAAAGLTLLAVALAGAACWLWRHQATQTCEIAPAPAVAAAEAAAGRGLLALPSTPVAAGHPIPDWTIRLGNRYRQSASVRTVAGQDPVLELKSAAPASELTVLSREIAAERGQRFTVEAVFYPGSAFRGQAALEVWLTRRDAAGRETSGLLLAKSPNLRRQQGGLAARETFELPAGAARLQVRLGGKFKGAVDIGRVSLVRK